MSERELDKQVEEDMNALVYMVNIATTHGLLAEVLYTYTHTNSNSSIKDKVFYVLNEWDI
jgi:hypothetical protein